MGGKNRRGLFPSSADARRQGLDEAACIIGYIHAAQACGDVKMKFVYNAGVTLRCLLRGGKIEQMGLLLLKYTRVVFLYRKGKKVDF